MAVCVLEAWGPLGSKGFTTAGGARASSSVPLKPVAKCSYVVHNSHTLCVSYEMKVTGNLC